MNNTDIIFMQNLIYMLFWAITIIAIPYIVFRANKINIE